MLVASPLDLQKNELRQAQIHNLASAPASPVKGQMYYDTAVNKLFWWNGTTWIDATGGTAATPDATTSVKGVVQLAGDLTGTAASPQIAAGAVTDAEVAAANKDGAVGVPSMRTIGSGSAQAMAGNTRLDLIPAPGGSVSLANNLITNLASPGSATDAANKQYVDGVAQGLDAKQSVLCASTGNLALSGLAAVDGITPGAFDRVLVKDQTTPAQNGIYAAAAGAWTRTTDTDSWGELPGAFVWVERGTQQDTGWVCTADQGGTLGTTAVTWTQFSGAGQITDGIGLLKTGNTLDVRLDGTTLEAPADILQVKDGGVSNAKIANSTIDLSTKVTGTLPLPRGGTGVSAASNGGLRNLLAIAGLYTNNATHGAGTTITIAQATHGLNASRGLMVQCRLEATGEEILADNTVAANGDVTVTFASSQSANTIRVVVVG